MKREATHRTNIMVQILDTQNATWQGTVTWGRPVAALLSAVRWSCFG